ncbi:alpha/beta fold hydrolase [Aeromicrobium sp. CTD01-1L150]|uniref:alpha/beta fold hydrolase n=1 Tax=Aeromicrobium sp. CTD01-1L150 TaxID=3341830 RepID=UPI0035C0A709
MPYAEVNGIRFHHTDTGPPPDRPDAPALVMGHGLLFSGWMFHHQVEALASEYRCITVDWRGQGRTPPVPASGGGAGRRGPRYAADMDSLTDDLVALLDHLGLERVHYAGLSMGGFVGMRLAARHPERVRSLILLDTSAGPEDPEKVKRYRLLARAYRWLGMRPVRKQVEPIMFGPTLLSSPRREEVVGPWMENLSAVDRSGMQAAILGVTDRSAVVSELGSITAPTLVIVGADDVATPVRKSEVIVAGIDDSSLAVVPEAGHSSTVEQPEAVTGLMRDFLATR